MAVSTVRSHRANYTAKIARRQARHDREEEVRAILHEMMPGPKPSNPRTPLYRVLRCGEGEAVRLNARPVTVEELLAEDPSARARLLE